MVTQILSRIESAWAFECQHVISEKISVVQANLFNLNADSQLHLTHEVKDTIKKNGTHDTLSVKLQGMGKNRYGAWRWTMYK